MKTEKYTLRHAVRILTASSLFDGHDAAINIMRRMLQASGAEVIHLGHNRSAEEIVKAALEEDVQALALTSYQGGHMEFFTYIYDMLQEKKAYHIKVYGGGGGTIRPQEILALQQHGIAKIYSPEDGRKMSLQGMINHLLKGADFSLPHSVNGSPFKQDTSLTSQMIASLTTLVENDKSAFSVYKKNLQKLASKNKTSIIGLTGTGGAGKSSLLDELIYRILRNTPKTRIAVLSIDPSRHKTGGALLGDRIRLNCAEHPSVYVRSMATRQAHSSLTEHAKDALLILQAAHFDIIFFESAGIGQADTTITQYSDLSVYVMTPEYGAATQLEKINMLDFADLVAINKSDRRGAADALREVQKQYQRNHQRFDEEITNMPVYATVASQFNDSGTDQLYEALMQSLSKRAKGSTIKLPLARLPLHASLIPEARIRYLSDISEAIRDYNQNSLHLKEQAQHAYVLQKSLDVLPRQTSSSVRNCLTQLLEKKKKALGDAHLKTVAHFEKTRKAYQETHFTYQVRDQVIRVENYTTSLSELSIPKISSPKFEGWGDILYWCLQENFPGSFPYTSGIFPFKRTEEDPARMFAGEGAPERTNKRFHYLSKGMSFARLSTAFDSVTLYGEDPALRPDIYGKVGNSGVSIASLNDAKKLYSGFDLCAPNTSVSMTINGPAATICAFFMHVAVDQQCELYLREQGRVEEVKGCILEMYTQKQLPSPAYAEDLPDQHNSLGLLLLGASGKDFLDADTYARIYTDTLSKVRGTVQADILKEDQAQNTCIFSTNFSLRLMADMQAYFIEHQVRNFYSVSISGYHIAEAGANPITQLAFTLANGFTYVEYYLSRGMKIDDFAGNLSFFFSNGLDPEYAVIGRVARRIWAKAMRLRYGANPRSQKLKYHIQTSGRSLHAQEIAFNDLRTTLQALYAIYDNCNSLHTNAYDEAITTPTEESVRRALAIQLIINKELGTAKSENILQGSFAVEDLTDLVEEAVLMEFDRISSRGGVLSAMENMYQRSKIQEESMHYEMRKNSGEHPIIGVNTFLADHEEKMSEQEEIIRATQAEKKRQVKHTELFKKVYPKEALHATQQLRLAALQDKNLFHALMQAAPYCTLGDISHTLYEVGGKYRRSM